MGSFQYKEQWHWDKLDKLGHPKINTVLLAYVITLKFKNTGEKAEGHGLYFRIIKSIYLLFSFGKNKF